MIAPETIPSGTAERRPRFVEPARFVPVKWLNYEIRLVAGIALLVAGFAGTCALLFPSDVNDHFLRGVGPVLAFLGALASAIILPGRGARRVAFAALALASAIPFILPVAMLNTPKPLAVLFYSLTAGPLAWAWLVVRERSGRLHLLAAVAFLFTIVFGNAVTAFIDPYGGLNIGWPEFFGRGDLAGDTEYVALLSASASIWILQMGIAAVGVIGVAWAARAISPRLRHVTPEQRAQTRMEKLARASEYQASQERAAQLARVEEVKKWESAYAEAHDGQAPPSGYAPAILVQASLAPASTRQNTLSILSLIFGLLGGWLGIVFGFIALAQMKRTGDSGRGMAIGGIVAAFIWILGYLIVVMIVVSVGR